MEGWVDPDILTKFFYKLPEYGAGKIKNIEFILNKFNYFKYLSFYGERISF